MSKIEFIVAWAIRIVFYGFIIFHLIAVMFLELNCSYKVDYKGESIMCATSGAKVNCDE